MWLRLVRTLSFCSTILLLFGSCSKDYAPFVFETIDMSLFNADNSGETPVLDMDSVPRQAYSIELDLTMILKDETGADKYESSFTNEDRVTQFAITSPDTFNAVLPNQSLNQFFNYSNGGGTGAAITTESYTAIFSGANRSQDNADSWTTKKNLLLMYPPSSAGNYSFIVSATFSDNRVLTDTIHVYLY